jgi:hypothetical protein
MALDSAVSQRRRLRLGSTVEHRRKSRRFQGTTRTRYWWFESRSLQRGVSCELGFHQSSICAVAQDQLLALLGFRTRG